MTDISAAVSRAALMQDELHAAMVLQANSGKPWMVKQHLETAGLHLGILNVIMADVPKEEA